MNEKRSVGSAYVIRNHVQPLPVTASPFSAPPIGEQERKRQARKPDRHGKHINDARANARVSRAFAGNSGNDIQQAPWFSRHSTIR